MYSMYISIHVASVQHGAVSEVLRLPLVTSPFVGFLPNLSFDSNFKFLTAHHHPICTF